MEVPGQAEPLPFFQASALECIAPNKSDTPAPAGSPLCANVSADLIVPSDGLLPSEFTFLLHADAFGDKLLVRAPLLTGSLFQSLSRLQACMYNTGHSGHCLAQSSQRAFGIQRGTLPHSRQHPSLVGERELAAAAGAQCCLLGILLQSGVSLEAA